MLRCSLHGAPQVFQIEDFEKQLIRLSKMGAWQHAQQPGRQPIARWGARRAPARGMVAWVEAAACRTEQRLHKTTSPLPALSRQEGAEAAHSNPHHFPPCPSNTRKQPTNSRPHSTKPSLVRFYFELNQARGST